MPQSEVAIHPEPPADASALPDTDGALSEYRSASEAAVRLGHATYSGTVAAASRRNAG